MAYTLYTTLKAKKISYGGSRSANSIKYIVLHYTGNKTDTAKANANFFSANGSNTRAAGAHYFVDAKSVYRSIDDLKIAYSVGGKKYSDCSKTGGGTMYGKITNSNSISIEMCSTNGAISSETVENAASLTKLLMKKYNVPSSRVYRHFDVTGKACPAWDGWMGKNAPKWTAFKKKLDTIEVRKNQEDDEVVVSTKHKIDGTERTINAITKNGVTYTCLRDLCDALGLKVSYDDKTATRVIELDKCSLNIDGKPTEVTGICVNGDHNLLAARDVLEAAGYGNVSGKGNAVTATK